MSLPKTLYHYCSTKTFYSIVEKRTLHLSSLSLSNDTMEGKLVAHTVSQLAQKESMDASKMLRLQQMLERFDEIFDGLGFCMSEERDLLSQWRGYAEDGAGVCIGLSTEYLEWLARNKPDMDKPGFSIQKVKYSPDEYEAQVAPTFAEAKRLIDGGAFAIAGLFSLLTPKTEEELEAERKRIEQARQNLAETLVSLLPKLYLLKSWAFREEREWRLLSHLVASDNDYSHRIRDHQIVPYRPVELLEFERKPIVELILGPKHPTPFRVIKRFLQCHGLDDVKVLQSDATYR